MGFIIFMCLSYVCVHIIFKHFTLLHNLGRKGVPKANSNFREGESDLNTHESTHHVNGSYLCKFAIREKFEQWTFANSTITD